MVQLGLYRHMHAYTCGDSSQTVLEHRNIGMLLGYSFGSETNSIYLWASKTKLPLLRSCNVRSVWAEEPMTIWFEVGTSVSSSC